MKNEELAGSEKTDFGKKLDGFLNSFSDEKNNTVEDWQKDYENLAERNQNQLDKLLKMLNDNPEEALKYAIPLDPNNSSRGGAQGGFTLNKRWGAFEFGGEFMQLVPTDQPKSPTE